MAGCRIYTIAEDTLDPDDPIFPRAATRVGTKFQAVVEDELDESKIGQPKSVHGEPSLPSLLSGVPPFPRADFATWNVLQYILRSFQSEEATARFGVLVGRTRGNVSGSSGFALLERALG